MEVALETTLTTDRLMLCSVDLSDVELVWEATRFEGFNDGVTWDPPGSREKIVDVIQRNLSHWKQGTEYIFTVSLLDTARAIGRVGLHKEEEPDPLNRPGIAGDRLC